MLQTTACNLIAELTHLRRKKILEETSYLNFYWLNVDFVRSCSVGVSEVKPAIQGPTVVYALQ
jgi:hypothetical protein